MPTGWKNETIPFPLDFAPQLPYKGVEELRFMPGFFDPHASGFFSYAFAWWLEGNPPFDAATLSRDLRTYFVGLARAVAEGKFAVDEEGTRADVTAAGPDAFTAKMHVFDAFKTKALITLHAELRVKRCGDHEVLMVTAAPDPWSPDKRAALEACAGAFTCPDRASAQ